MFKRIWKWVSGLFRKKRVEPSYLEKRRVRFERRMETLRQIADTMEH